MRLLHARVLLSILGLFLVALPAGAQTPAFDLALTLRSPEPTAAEQFGYSVAVVPLPATEGAERVGVLVGAPFDDWEATDAGAAFLFDGATGELLQSFRSPNPAAGDWFGIAVAAVPLPGTEGVGVLVGALGDDTGERDAGAAYLFDARTGELIRAFQKPTPAEADWFGGAVAAVPLPASDGTARAGVLIGAPLDDLGAPDAGAAYLFDAESGALLQTFPNPTPNRDDWFGVGLAAGGNRVLVGAFLDDAAGTDAGAAHLFDLASGALVRSFTGAGAGGWFGVAVAPFEEGFLIGAPMRNAGARGAGEVYRVSAEGDLLQSYPSPAPVADGQFGRAVAAAGTSLVVGAPGPAEAEGPLPGGSGGSVWLLPAEGDPVRLGGQPARGPGDQFGFALAAAGNLLVIGAPTADAPEANSGAAYLFRAP